MIESIPTFLQFTRLYWNQMGDEAYGSIENAFSEFLRDCRKSSEYMNIVRSLYLELEVIADSEEYERWLHRNTSKAEYIRLAGGRFVWPDEANRLRGLLDSLGLAPDS